MASADLVIGCDPIVVAGKETVLRMRQGRTHVALNSHSAPTAAFVQPQLDQSGPGMPGTKLPVWSGEDWCGRV
jgi:hypothetical protein